MAPKLKEKKEKTMRKKVESLTFDTFSRHPVNKALTFHIYDVDLALVNAIRRVIISLLPNVACNFQPYNDEESDIRFIVNTSSLHNEFLGHRISLIPIKLDEDEIVNFDKSKYNFEIYEHNTTKDKLEVTTDNIKITDEYGDEKDKAFHQKVFPRCPITGDPILIVVLNENNYNPEFGEKLHVKFRASIGVAKTHSRYSPVSTCTYHNLIDEEKANIAREKYVKEQQDIYKIDVNTLRKRFDVHDKFRHFKTNEYDEPSAFAFTIEMESRLTEKYVVSKALDILVQKLQAIVDQKRLKITPLGQNAFSTLIQGEQHTMGNLIQAMLYNIFVREKKVLSYVGYYLVHPLVEEIVLKMTFKNEKEGEEKTVDDAVHFLKEGIKEIQNVLKKLQSTWEKEYMSV